MYTRSQKKSVSAKPAPRSIFSRDNKRWTVKEEREMIRLRRHENLPFANIAHELHRSPEAIKFRFEKLLMEHSEGLTDVTDVLRWFNLSDE
jgi:hypothetical protein